MLSLLYRFIFCVAWCQLQVLRLRLPAEVRVSESKCQRSKVNGALLIIMPKVNPNENAVTIRGDQRAREAAAAAANAVKGTAAAGLPTVPIGGRTATTSSTSTKTAGGSAAGRTVLKPKKISLHEQMLLDAQAAAAAAPSEGDSRSDSLLDANIGTSKAAVNVANIVRRKEDSCAAPTAATVEDTVFKMSNRVVELD